jgi:hypothetical protein
MPRRNDSRTTMLLTVAILLTITVANAQVDCFYRTLHIGRLHGIVTDQLGDPVSDAIVRLKRDGNSVAEARTDGTGQFAIKKVTGHFDLTIEATGFSKAWSPLEIGRDVQSLFQKSMLRVMLLVGGGEDCEVVTTNKKEFEKAVRTNRQRFKGIEEKNATQK